MREIKFRAWNTKTLKMWLWEKLEQIKRFAITSGASSDDFIVLPKQDYIDIMQYIGLKDVDGNEIYRSDILSYGGGVAEVRQDEETAGYFAKGEETYVCPENFKKAKVIGNIYENPELREKEEK